MTQAMLIKRDPETYVVHADTAWDAMKDAVVPVVGEVYGKFKCVSLDATRCHNLTDTWVIVAKFKVQLPDEFFIRIGAKVP